MQSSFKEYFQLIVFHKLLDSRLEKSYVKKHTCHLDLHQRSHYVTNGQRNWVQKLFNNQKEKLFDNQKENFFRQTKFFQSTQLTPNPIRD